jgi:hypothetical protein
MVARYIDLKFCDSTLNFIKNTFQKLIPRWWSKPLIHNVAFYIGRIKRHGPVGSTLSYFEDTGSDFDLETGYID